MLKLMTLSLMIGSLLTNAAVGQDRFANYRKIEAYEVRPGILIMPRYSAANEICEIGLEKLQYSPSIIRVDSELSREEIFQTLDELVPAVERGAPSKDTVGDLISRGGLTQTTNIEYENVLIRIYGAVSQLNPKHKNELGATTEVVATVTWKNRKCR